MQYPCLQGGGALGDASAPGWPADSIAASAHRGTYSHGAVAGETWGGEKGAAAGTAAAAARRRRATPTGGAFTPPRSAPLRICVHHYTLRAPCPKGQGIAVWRYFLQMEDGTRSDSRVAHPYIP